MTTNHNKNINPITMAKLVHFLVNNGAIVVHPEKVAYKIGHKLEKVR